MQGILVAIKLKENEYFDETLEECLRLCDAANIEIIKTITQASSNLDPNTALRKGKLEELKETVDNSECELVVFYNNLNTKIVSNLQEYLDVDVIDRTNLILNIFSLRAKSREAQIQTQIASLKYDLSKLLKDNIDQDKQRGGTLKNRGAGEVKGDLIRRQMESRINNLKEELKKLENRKENEYQNRNKTGLKKVALVGYTNAGKSSLMNNLLIRNEKEDKSVYEKDQLFATLDTSVRNIKYKKHEFLLFDTVGFVSDLPHSLIEAFNSTLKAANYADLLIHVVDVSNPNYKLQEKITLDTLKQIKADNIPMIYAYNKADLVENKNDDLLYISCKNNTGIDELLETIENKLFPQDLKEDILIPYSLLKVIEKYKNKLNFTFKNNEDAGSLYEISGNEDVLSELKKNIGMN